MPNRSFVPGTKLGEWMTRPTSDYPFPVFSRTPYLKGSLDFVQLPLDDWGELLVTGGVVIGNHVVGKGQGVG